MHDAVGAVPANSEFWLPLSVTQSRGRDGAV